MISDGRWKWELQKLSWAISIWRRCTVFDRFAEHRLNRAILYSAVILRKVMEDEKEVETIAELNQFPLPKQETIHAELSAIKYPYTAEQGWAVRGVLHTDDYGIGKSVTVKSKDVCNQLIHSYIWKLACIEGKHGYYGFLTSSDRDKEKHVYFLSFDEWQRLIQLAIEKGTF